LKLVDRANPASCSKRISKRISGSIELWKNAPESSWRQAMDMNDVAKPLCASLRHFGQPIHRSISLHGKNALMNDDLQMFAAFGLVVKQGPVGQTRCFGIWNDGAVTIDSCFG
jgi:hypothetical protein